MSYEVGNSYTGPLPERDGKRARGSQSSRSLFSQSGPQARERNDEWMSEVALAGARRLC